MDRTRSNLSLNRSSSTLEDLPSEKVDPLMEHIKNADAMTGNGSHMYNSSDDVEAQSVGRSLTRADTAAWVTKHPSRIPDDGRVPLLGEC
jgi:hypothetical protein